MKKKKLKKLSLKKEKIANLNQDQMNELQGGTGTPCGISIVVSIILTTVCNDVY